MLYKLWNIYLHNQCWFSPWIKLSCCNRFLIVYQIVPYFHTVRKVSRYGVFSGPYFPAFGLNTERSSVSLRIQSECGKIRTRKNSVFGHFSRSDSFSSWIRRRDTINNLNVSYRLIILLKTSLIVPTNLNYEIKHQSQLKSIR